MCLGVTLSLLAEVKLLYSDTFQGWTDVASSTTPTTVNKTTDFSNETLSFILSEIQVSSTGTNTKFAYPPCSVGYLMCAKTATPYIQTSPLKSITKIYIVEAATGSSRGYQVWKKADGDADWVSIYNTVASPGGGDSTTIAIPGGQTNVALKFTNLNSANNAYLTDLKIYGDYSSTKTQVTLNASVADAASGSVTVSPASATYDINSTVKLTANRNFGYKFVKWVDGIGNDLSTENPYSVLLDGNKTIKAVFEAVATYNYTVSIIGSQWGKVTLSPAPTNGKYETGSVVIMKVVPNMATNFSYWEDNTTDLTRTIQVNADKSFAATFDEIPFITGWDFAVLTPLAGRSGDYFSETSNVGSISAYENTGVAVNWSASAAIYNPALPCIRLWTSVANFATPRYVQASFSTVGYKNINVKSKVGAQYHVYPIETMQYSLDGTNFTKIAQTDITSVYGSSWADLNATLPADAEGQTKIYVRWIEDATSTPVLGNATDIDGMALTNIFVYADKVVINDVTPPTLVSSVPTEGANNASANGSIVLTFDEKIKAGTGNCSLGSTILTPVFGLKTVTFAYSKLAYNTDYTFTVPAGALTDVSGNAYTELTLHFRTMNRPQPIAKVFDAVIASDGTGNYTTVQAAIDAVPNNSVIPYLIFVKNGIYSGHVNISITKPNIHLIGQNRDSVVFTDNRLCGASGSLPVYGVDPGASTVVNSTNCYFENITFENSWGFLNQTGPQALAMFSDNDRIVFKNCDMRSYQDTYLTSTRNITDRHYLLNCRIEGAVDFIYGSSDVFFDHCTIYCTRLSGGYIVAPNHSVGTQWGYVFSNCTLDGPSGVTTYLGRPWHNAPKTSYFNTISKIGIYPVGWWYKMGAIPAIFADYNTMDANGNPMDLTNRISSYQYDVTDANGVVTSTVTGTAKNSFTDAEAAQYTLDNVMKGSDSWDPRTITEATEAPANVTEKKGNLIWTTTNYAICYLVLRNSKVIGMTTNTNYIDMSYTAGALYKVIAVAESGALSNPTTAKSIVDTGLESLRSKVFAYINDKNLFVNNVEIGSTVSVYTINGMLLRKQIAVSTIVSIPINSACIVKVTSNSETINLKMIK